MTTKQYDANTMIPLSPIKNSDFLKIKLPHYNYVISIIILAFIYILAARLGLLLATAEGNITLFWPPSGIALAALVIFGRRLWPGILIGAFFADILATGNVIASIGMSIGSTASALFGLWLLGMLIGRENPLSRTVHLYKFFIIALISTIIAAIIGTTSLVMTGVTDWSSFNSIALTWWLGDTAGIFVFTPLIISWQRNVQPPLNQNPKYFEVILFSVLLILISSLPFISSFPLHLVGYPLAFISFPFCIWAAYRYCLKQVTVTILIIMIVAIYGTIIEQGPFHRETLSESLFQLQAFMIIVVVTTLSLASAVFERQRFEFQLIQQKKKAEELTLAKSQFMSNMSHELRTPLNAIIGFSHILEKDDSNLSKQQYEFVGYISDAGNHLLHLVNDLLDIEQSDSHKLNIKTRRINLHDSILESIHFIEHMASKRDISIYYNKEVTKNLDVMADPIRLRQILINLLSNAAKYNHDNGRISIVCDKKESSHISIAISDTGDGIAKEDIPTIFDPFNRLQIEDSQIEGSGIGLTVAHKLVELMNGTITVTSELGKGSTFIITLPSK